MSTRLRTESHEDAQATARAAARHVAARAREAVATRGRFCVAFSGGRTPGAMLAALAGESLPWDRVHVFQVDERVAPAGDAARNLTMLRAALGAGPLPAANLHAMPVDGADLDACAARYAARLEEIAGGRPPLLDLVHLGLGDDGHTASLVPGDAALDARGAAVTMTGEYRGHRRMTLTFEALDAARERLWLATGADKAAMLARLDAGDAGIPAGRIRRDASVVFADAAALAR